MPRKSISKKNKIPLPLYRKIVASIPICCVDAVFWAGNKVYLFKRTYEPAKNKWWLIGGRIIKGERLRDAVLRKVKEEVCVDARILKIVGTYELFFRSGRFDGNFNKKGSHAISICYVVKPKRNDFKLKLNEEYSDYKAITKIEKNLDPYVKRVLEDSGVLG